MHDHLINAFSPDRLHGYRDRAGMTRQAVAAAIGSTPAIVKNYETGVTLPVDPAVRSLARALGITPDDLTIREHDPVADYVSALMDGGPPLSPAEIAAAATVLRRSRAHPAVEYRRVRIGGVA